MAQDLSTITTAVENSTTVEESAITLLNEISAALTAAAGDPAAVQALADQISANSAALAAAVVANTPVVP